MWVGVLIVRVLFRVHIHSLPVQSLPDRVSFHIFVSLLSKISGRPPYHIHIYFSLLLSRLSQCHRVVLA